jgi:hypothetical protein
MHFPSDTPMDSQMFSARALFDLPEKIFTATRLRASNYNPPIRQTSKKSNQQEKIGHCSRAGKFGQPPGEHVNPLISAPIVPSCSKKADLNFAEFPPNLRHISR